jgi:hypothetical protein
MFGLIPLQAEIHVLISLALRRGSSQVVATPLSPPKKEQ